MNRVIAKNLSAEMNDRLLFSRLSFTAEPGDIWQIVGRNGSGKTTLLRMLAGLDLPTEGQVSLEGSGHFSYLGHQSAIKANLTVNENLLMSISHRSVAHQKQQIDTALERVNLTYYKDTLAAELSAGQQRRIALARLILAEAAIWIVDEPLTALDWQGQTLVTELLQQHQQSQGITIFTSHQRVAPEQLSIQEINLS